MKRFLLIFGSLFFLVGCATFQPTTEDAKIPVLMYHRVSDDFPPGATVIHRQRFQQHLDLLVSDGYHTATAQELTDHMEGRKTLPKKSVVITFDDGRDDNFDAARELHIRNLAATFYIISGQIDAPGYLNSKEIAWLSSMPRFEIGSHTHTHFLSWATRLNSLPAAEALSEIKKSKREIEAVTGKPVTSFAWPYGHIIIELIGDIKKAGYTNTMIVGNETKNDHGISAFTIMRVNVHGDCSIKDLKYILDNKSHRGCK